MRLPKGSAIVRSRDPQGICCAGSGRECLYCFASKTALKRVDVVHRDAHRGARRGVPEVPRQVQLAIAVRDLHVQDGRPSAKRCSQSILNPRKPT